MKATDLRIGNYVLSKLNTTVKVSMVHKEGVRFGQRSLTYRHLKPIPLTEEWLLKFGFEIIDNVAKQGVLYIYKQDGIWWYDIVLDSVEIKSVHQLQNLYHSLTGKELVCA